jgi:hypothetical protein
MAKIGTSEDARIMGGRYLDLITNLNRPISPVLGGINSQKPTLS